MGTSSTRAKNKYNKTAYRQLNLKLKPEIMEALNKHCEAFSHAKNSFITQAIKEKIERETNKNFDELLKELQPAKETETAKSAEASATEKGEE